MIYLIVSSRRSDYTLMMLSSIDQFIQKKTATTSSRIYSGWKNGQPSGRCHSTYKNVNSYELQIRTNPIHFQCTLHNEVLREVTHSKYLGVIIDSKLSWSQHIREVTNKANIVKGFYSVTFEVVQYLLRLTVISLWSNQSWSMLVLSGHHTRKRI